MKIVDEDGFPEKTGKRPQTVQGGIQRRNILLRETRILIILFEHKSNMCYGAAGQTPATEDCD